MKSNQPRDDEDTGAKELRQHSPSKKRFSNDFKVLRGRK
jgi:hypothetical protein